MQRVIVCLLLVLGVAMGQAATGSVTVSTTISAIATQGANDPNAVACTATPLPVVKQIAVTCKVGTSIGLDSTYTVLPGSTLVNAAVVSYSFGGNIVTWMLYQPDPAGPVFWQVAANGISKQGTF